jgi:hypothetical protein
MANFMYYHRLQNLTIHDSACQVYDQLIAYWWKARLPVREKHHIVQKIEILHSEYKHLLKNRTRSNEKDKNNQKQYSDKLEMLFDVSHAKSDSLIKNDEDKQFLKLQREGRIGSLGPVDKKLAEKEKRAAERKLKEKMRVEAAVVHSVMVSTEHPSCSSAEEDVHVDVEQDPDFIHSLDRASKRPRRTVSTKVSATLDRTKTSIRKSAMIMATVLNDMGADPSLVPSRSTIHRHRLQNRTETAEAIKRDYCPTKSVVHWDGKLLPNFSDTESFVDRLPVLLSSLIDGTTKLLGVPALESGTGRAVADGVHEQLKLWNFEEQVVAMCFDTTASNTGKFAGACRLLEDCLGRNLLWLPCRHHVHEVLLSDAFTVCFGPSSGPDILIFKRFRERWGQLNHKEFQLQGTPLLAAPDDIKAFIQQQVTHEHPREDYLDLLTLAGLLIGLNIESAIRKPGAIHRARWMAKAIYSLKMQLLLNGNETVIQLSGRELQGLQRFNRFVVLI